MEQKERIVVIGGGFAGLQFIQNLPKNTYDILLIDKLNHHQFQPLFYQVATSVIEPSSISFPFRKIFSGRKDIRIRLTHVEEILPDQSMVKTPIGNFPFDTLVIATGAKTNYFGNKNIQKNVYSLKTTYEAITIRNSILENFEKLLYAEGEELEALYNIVVVGGGPTGVELAGAFAEIKRDILPKDYHRVDFKRLNIYLLEGSQHTLNNMSEISQKGSFDYLTKMGVTIKLGVFVTDYDGTKLTMNNGETLQTKQVIWTAGVTGNVISGLSPESLSHSNRYIVDRHNLVKGYDHIYAIGDISLMQTPTYPKGHPQLANVAKNQGILLAKNLVLKQAGKPQKEYEYKDLGTMATVGRNKAIVELPFVKFKGYFAWVVWMFLHLMLILSVKNKLIVFINWASNYLTKNSSLRLILKSGDKPNVDESA